MRNSRFRPLHEGQEHVALVGDKLDALLRALELALAAAYALARIDAGLPVRDRNRLNRTVLHARLTAIAERRVTHLRLEV